MILGVLSAILGIAVLVLAYIAYQKNSEAKDARYDSRAHQADATVQRARATKYKKVLETWGEDVERMEREAEVAAGGKAGPAAQRLRDRFAQLRGRVHKDPGGGETGGGGEGGDLPGKG